MQSAYERLVRQEEKIIQLFDPPFDKSDLNPGYIKGYVPGVRENGGQYTHAAVWLAMAFAAMGNREKTWELMQLINPVNHGSTSEKIEVYKVEPYVIAADVYRMDWTDMQVLAYAPGILGSRDGSGCGQPYNTNAGVARSEGIEFQANFYVTEAFRAYLRPLLGAGLPETARLRAASVARVLAARGR